MQSRAAGLDALRIVAVLAVVLGHTTSNAVVRELVFPWHVAIFFVLTGYLWRPDRTVLDEIKRRWQTLVVPYFAWLGIIAVPLLAYEAIEVPGTTHRRLVSFVHGGTELKTPFHAFWFMCALFVAAVAFRLLTNSIGERPAQIIGLACILLTLTSSHLREFPYAAGLGILCVFFVAVGHLLQRHQFLVARLWPLSLAGGAFLVASHVAPPIDIKLGHWGHPIVSFVASALVCAGLIGLFEAIIPAKPIGWISSAASLATVVVLTHGVPLYLLGGRLPWWLAAVASLSFALAMCWVSRKRPALGMPRANRPMAVEDEVAERVPVAA